MTYLLDTHTVLWFLEDDPQLPKNVSREIANIEHKCFVSIASLWETAIKIKLGKLTIKFPFEKQGMVENCTILSKDENFAGYPVKTVWK